MRNTTVNGRLAFSAAIVIVSTSAVWAQQAVPAPAPDAARSQIEGFENSLRNAIDAAARKLTGKVREAFPNVPFEFRYQVPPVVTGVLMPDVGPIFHVLIPAIEDLQWKVFSMNARSASQQGQRVANTAGRVGAPGLVEPDPMHPLLANPDREYTDLVRASLIDAVLDSALSLTIPPSQHLTVIAGDLPTEPVTPFSHRSRMLILQLKGEDLVALRENRINRDEAKARIKESKFPN